MIVNRGGTRSSKSYSLAQLAVLFLMTGKVSPDVELDSGTWSIVRKTMPSLRSTVMRDFREIVSEAGLW